MLEKLKIIGLKDASESSIGLGSFASQALAFGIPYSIYIAMFNPEKFSVSNSTQYHYDNSSGSTGSEQRFDKISPRSFSFEFLIDGTGASGEKRIVEVDIKLFKYTVGYVGDTHRPTYLIINWGTFLVRCVLKSLTVNYTLFDANGIPLRATLSASFEEQIVPALEQLQNFLSSPDVTHVRTASDADRLDNMSYKIYKHSKYYMELARVNQLNQFRKLKVGASIAFPPIEQTKK
jgi:hypothetical protein